MCALWVPLPDSDFYDVDDETGETRNHDTVPLGGFGRLVDAFDKALRRSPRAQVLRGAAGEVVSVRYAEGVGERQRAAGDGSSERPSVLLQTRSGDTIRAGAAIVTVPLGVLQNKGSPRFVPPLPSRKRDALARLTVGALNEIVMR